MKKIMLATIVAIAVVSGFIGVHESSAKTDLNQFALVNIEALSDVEGSGEIVYNKNCERCKNEICCPSSGPIVYDSRPC